MATAHMHRILIRAGLFAFLLTCAALPLVAQERDSTPAPRPARARVEITPPLSPRRAFLYSLALPGYAQTVLGRSRSATIYLGFEAIALVMIRESAGSLREARRNLADSLPVSYVDAAGQPGIRWQRTPFSRALVKSRQEQVEDWIAVLIGNHLFSGADAYVASLLWDLPAEVAIRPAPHSTKVALRLYW